MKKITLLVITLISFTSFAQKDELKALKKSYSIKSSPSEKDMLKYNEAIMKLDNMKILDKNEINEYNFYKGVQPFLSFFNLALKSSSSDLIENSFSIEDVKTMSEYFAKVIQYENDVLNFEFRDEIKNTILPFVKPYISSKAYNLNSKKSFIESSNLFYALYELDKNDGINIENAAVLAIQANEIELGLKYYKEFRDSDYLENGKLYYAVNALTSKEELLNNKIDRDNRVKLGTYTNPRDENVSIKKPEIYKNIAILYAQNNQLEEAKKAYKDAKKIDPNNVDLLINEANLYSITNDKESYKALINEILIKDPNNASLHFNIGYLGLSDDVKLVEEINKNLDNKKKYDELTTKRRSIYQLALPHFEESYRLDPSVENTKIMLKSTYQVLGMKDKADKL